LSQLDFVCTDVQNLGRIGSCIADEMALPRKLRVEDTILISGAPRREPPEHVLEAAKSQLTATGYAPRRGMPKLQNAIAQRVERQTGQPVDASNQVVVMNGAMQALHIVMSSLLSNGDEVVIPTPSYSYDGLVRLAHGNPVYVPMSPHQDYKWDLDKIEAAITRKTKLLIVNTPVNPTGRVLSADELKHLVQIAQQHNLLIVADEAYDRLVYDDNQHVSIYGVEGAAERTLLVQSATK